MRILTVTLLAIALASATAYAETVDGAVRETVRSLPGTIEIGDHFKVTPETAFEGGARAELNQHVCVRYEELGRDRVAQRIKIVPTGSMLASQVCDCASVGAGCYEGDVLTVSSREGGAATVLTVGERFAVSESTILQGYDNGIKDIKLLDRVRIDYAMRNGANEASKITLLERGY